MIRNYNVYPKNKIGGGIGIFQLPIRHINSFSADKNGKYEYKSAFPKSKKIKKLIDEINLSNKTQTSNNNINPLNNLYTCQKLLKEERIKNKKYYENIIQLNNHIDELEYQLNHRCQHEIINDEIIMLRKENEELRQFKQKVYEFSMKYDEVNKDILLCLKNIEKAVELFNINISNNNHIEYKNDTLNKISENYNSIINNLTNFLNKKQDEYNTLLGEKENEINKLKSELNNKINFNKYNENFKDNIPIENECDKNIYENNENNYQTNGIYNPYMLQNLKLNLGINNEKDNLGNNFQNV